MPEAPVFTLAGRCRLVLTTRALDETGRHIGRYLLGQSLVNTSFGVAVGPQEVPQAPPLRRRRRVVTTLREARKQLAQFTRTPARLQETT